MQTLVVLCLVLQNCGLVLVTKYSYRDGARPYNTSSVILAGEVVKLVVCCLIETCRGRSKLQDVPVPLHTKSMLFVPATLYVIQNNLQFFAIKGLSSGVFIVCSQLKIASSAVFSAIILKRQTSKRQSLAVVLLMIGVAVVQLGGTSVEHAFAEQNETRAFLALLIAVTTSGLAGAMLEATFKRKDSSIWQKNFFLSLFSVPFAALTAINSIPVNESLVSLVDLFHAELVIIILLQAVGGLLTAAVMKYAGVVSKCFAVSLSTVICTVVGQIMGEDNLQRATVVGAVLVNAAVVLFFLKRP